MLERHTGENSTKLQFGLLTDILGDLGFTLKHQDSVMIQRQFDPRSTGWVSIRDVVRFLTPGFRAVQRLHVYVIPNVNASGDVTDSVSVTIEPLY